MVADLSDTLAVGCVSIPFKRFGSDQTESDCAEIVGFNNTIEYGVANRDEMSCGHEKFARHIDDGMTGDHTVGNDHAPQVFGERLCIGVAGKKSRRTASRILGTHNG